MRWRASINGMAALLGSEWFRPERYLQRAPAIDPDDRTSAALLLREYVQAWTRVSQCHPI